MKKFASILLLILSGYFNVSAQSTFIPMSIDFASFRGPEDKTHLEIYLSFHQSYLQYISQDSGYIAEYFASAEIGKEDSIYYQNYERKLSRIDSLPEISKYRKYLSIFKFSLDSGRYAATVKLKDLHSERSGEYYFDFDVFPFSDEKLSLSSIQLCSHIKPDTSQNIFQKNSYQTIPNPDNIYSVTQPVLYYYCELYNLKYNSENPGQYRLQSHISDLEGNIIKEYPEKISNKPGSSAVLVGGHNLITLPPATYILKLKITDIESGEFSEAYKRFIFHKPTDRKIALEDTSGRSNFESIDISEYVNLTDEELNLEFNKLSYLISGKDSKIFQSLDPESKRIYLARFWKRLDRSPDTETNEFKVFYISMIDYANSNFGTMNRKGFETDRGRILLTYGQPNEIERNYMVLNKKPHEIWYYHELEGGAQFIFADITGYGEFDLIHSTYSRELYHPDWERLIIQHQPIFE